MDYSFAQHLNPFIQWIHTHPDLAGFVTFLISLAESIALIGLIVPGAIIMSAIGTLVGAQIIPAYSTMMYAALGAIVGDFLSYKIGYHYTDNVKNTWPFKRYPKILMHAEDFFHRHGGKSVFLGRFVGPMRPIIPLIAGMMRMSQIRFLISAIIAGTLWSPIYMLPGLLIGAASQQLAPETATRFLIVALAILLLIWFTAWFFKFMLSKLIHLIDQKMDSIWAYFQKHRYCRFFCTLLQDPEHPDRHGQLTLLLAIFMLMLLFIGFVHSVTHGGVVTILNQPTHQLFRNIQTAFGTKLMILISFIGYKYVLGVMVIFVFIWMIASRYFWAALHWIGITVFTGVVISLSKHIIQSPRPDGLPYLLEGNSFPSGHTTMSIALYGFLAFLIGRNFSRPSQRKYIYTSTTVLCLLIMISRLYLGAHWVTDVIGGGFVGLMIVFITIISFRRISSPKLKTQSLIIASLFGLLAALPWQMTHNYEELTEIYTPYWPTYSASLNTWWHQQTDNPPLYRPNRVGHPVEIMNVQWVGDLNMIENTLTAAGWKIVPKLSVIDLVNRVASHDSTQNYPILSPLYLGQRPQFAAIKCSTQNHVMYIRLWASNIAFTDSQLPLFVGTITYQIPQENKFWMHQKYLKKLSKLSAPTQELLPDIIHDYRYRLLQYDNFDKPQHVPFYQWNGGVILIMPNDADNLRAITQSTEF
jgi:membrane protein DedA with SNARE-associated domain/membrane-associated phospholipid phosphatase